MSVAMRCDTHGLVFWLSGALGQHLRWTSKIAPELHPDVHTLCNGVVVQSLKSCLTL